MKEIILPIIDKKFAKEVFEIRNTLPPRKYKEVKRKIEFVVTKK